MPCLGAVERGTSGGGGWGAENVSAKGCRALPREHLPPLADCPAAPWSGLFGAAACSPPFRAALQDAQPHDPGTWCLFSHDHLLRSGPWVSAHGGAVALLSTCIAAQGWVRGPRGEGRRHVRRRRRRPLDDVIPDDASESQHWRCELGPTGGESWPSGHSGEPTLFVRNVSRATHRDCHATGSFLLLNLVFLNHFLRTLKNGFSPKRRKSACSQPRELILRSCLCTDGKLL